MNNQCILVHYHEIGLKGDNRSWFEDKLLHNIRIQLNDLPYQKIKIAAARIFIIGIDPEYYDKYNDCLKNVMGIKHAFIMSIIDKTHILFILMSMMIILVLLQNKFLCFP